MTVWRNKSKKMINDNLRGFLGLCRKAGKMSLGHDAVITSIKKRKAQLVITCCDASDRLKNEMKDECSFQNRNIKYVDVPFSMKELSLCINARAGVISIDDYGFAEKLYMIIGGNENG
jgi:ribosomal protein L7Ae-like RNA K-turn-binding protein